MDITGFCEDWFPHITLLIVVLGSIVFLILGFLKFLDILFINLDQKKGVIHGLIFSLSGCQSIIIVVIFCIAGSIFQNLTGIGLFPMVLLFFIFFIGLLLVIVNAISFFIGLILRLIINIIAILFIRLIKTTQIKVEK